MSGVGYVAALVLAVVLTTAAAAKRRYPMSTRVAFEALGVPAPPLAARLVPGVEVVVAVALVIWPRPAAAAALIVLAVFTGFLLRARRRGVTCACFGVSSTSGPPVSAVELARNAGLATLALLSLQAQRAWPGLAAAVVTTTATASVAVVLALGHLRIHVGQVWSTVLAGEGS